MVVPCPAAYQHGSSFLFKGCRIKLHTLQSISHQKDKTCSARDQLFMSWKAMLLLLLILYIYLSVLLLILSLLLLLSSITSHQLELEAALETLSTPEPLTGVIVYFTSQRKKPWTCCITSHKLALQGSAASPLALLLLQHKLPHEVIQHLEGGQGSTFWVGRGVCT